MNWRQDGLTGGPPTTCLLVIVKETLTHGRLASSLLQDRQDS